MTLRQSFTRLAAAALAAVAMSPASAQEVTLKVHFFLPASSYANTMFIQPWCDKIAKDSNNRMKCQSYPSMQLGGTPPQLFEQARDGVADVVWTLPGYTAGRFPSVEVFELPFMMQNPEATSKALWDYVEKYGANEFKDVKPLAFHVHGDGVFHMTSKPVRTAADLKGLKLRAPTRMTNRFISVLGATPVAMPVPQVGDALSKGVIDGAVVPYEVVPSVKIQELVKYHSETDPSRPALYTSVFIIAMNPAKYNGLPADLKAIIDKTTGEVMVGKFGAMFDEVAADTKKRIAAQGNKITTLSATQVTAMKQATASVEDEWAKQVGEKGLDGKKLIAAARELTGTTK